MQTHVSKPIHAEFNDAASYCEQAESPAEIHGIFIGLLCRDAFTPVEKWVQALELEGTANDSRFQTVREQLGDMWNYCHQSLNLIDTEFEPLLPSDDELLAERSAELGAWSQGFLYGFSLQSAAANHAENDHEDKDEDEEEDKEEEIASVVSEILQDVVEISQVASDFDGADAELHESDEAAFIELVEYLRVSIQLVFEEMAGQKMSGRREPIYVDPRYMKDYADDDDSLH